jgi:2-desacetyl-2-hydroxyethyl bacteriochlorophyllide A dehydrogenase
MKYIVCEKPGQFSIQAKDEPGLTEGSALLRVKRVGICGTDLHAFKGNQPFFSYPRILGHELAAEVIAIDSKASSLSPGEKVVIMPYINCGTCAACKAGKSNCCESLKVFGVHVDGGMQEVISLPARLLIAGKDLSLEEIAIVEPLSIGAHALRRAGTKPGDVVVVMGCGPIGIGIIQFAKYIGATVIAMDINDHRLELVKEQFGADAVINTLHDPLERVKEFTHGDLAHTVFDATGNKQAMESGPDYMRHGGQFVLVGLFKGGLTFEHPALHAKEASLLCSRNATLQDFQFVMKALQEGKFNTGAYITRHTGFDSIVTDFPAWAGPESSEIKIVTTL